MELYHRIRIPQKRVSRASLMRKKGTMDANKRYDEGSKW
jgi:hypothetical protein